MGGNVFKDKQKNPATIQINKVDVLPTVRWLETLTDLPLQNNMLGTTGVNDTSGDIDLAVESSKITKDELINRLLKKGIDKLNIRKSGDNVHLKTPINGIVKNGYVQTDFMFGDTEWQKFSLQGAPASSKYKGMHRHILLASIAKAQNMKWSYKNGLVDRSTSKIISKDPEVIARLLINGTASDLKSVESILSKIKSYSNYSLLVNDAALELSL